MLESFFILLAGGVLLAAAAPRVGEVRPAWLRFAGGVALASAVVGALLAMGRGGLVETPPFFRRVQAVLVGLTLLCVIAHIACVYGRRLGAARLAAVGAAALAVLAGSNLLHDAMLTRSTAVAFPPKGLAMALQTLSAAGVASIIGFTLMTALFPLYGVPREAGPGPSAEAIVPAARSLRRLQQGVVAAVIARAVVSVGIVLLLQAARPVPGLWASFGSLISLRWLAGLVGVLVFAALARRRVEAGRTLSAAALLLAAALLAADAELLALYLVRETGLPF